MPDREELLALAERFTGEPGPDRTLDRLFGEALGHPMVDSGNGRGLDYAYYSSSIDVAVASADPKWWLELAHRRHPETDARACCAVYSLGRRPYTAGAWAANFPMAICAAILRATAELLDA